MNFFRALLYATSNLFALGQTAGAINTRLCAEFGLDLPTAPELAAAAPAALPAPPPSPPAETEPASRRRRAS